MQAPVPKEFDEAVREVSQGLREHRPLGTIAKTATTDRPRTAPYLQNARIRRSP